MPARPDGFRSVESRGLDRSIVTEQAMRTARPIVPFSESGASALSRSYWLEVARASRGLVRHRETSDGVELTILGAGPCLLRLGAVEISVERARVSCTYRIRGGLLAVGEGGTLRIAQLGGEPTELQVAVDGFLARGGLIYALQRRLHVAVSRRFFRRLVAASAT